MLADLPVIPPILRQHAEGAAFLWWQRDGHFDDPAMDETELGRLDRRLSGHVDGLVASGLKARDELAARFEDFPEAGEAFAWAVTGLVAEDGPTLAAALAAVGAAGRDAWRGVLGAVAWAGRDAVKPHVRHWIGAPDALPRLLAVAAHEFARVDPGPRLAGMLADPEAVIRARAFRLAAALGRQDVAGTAADRIAAAGGEEERYEAARCALLLGAPEGAREALVAMAEGDGERADRALELVVLAGGLATRDWLGRLMRRPERRHAAVAIAGAIDDPSVRSWLIRKCDEPPFSAAAGEALRSALDIDLDDAGVFEPDPEIRGPGFADREDGPWPVGARVRDALDVRARGGAGTFVNLPTLRRRALLAALADPPRPLPEWRHRRAYPAWS